MERFRGKILSAGPILNDSDKKEFEGSLRAFYSTANTEIPNDQAGFTDFCYGNLDKTKEVVAENNKI